MWLIIFAGEDVLICDNPYLGGVGEYVTYPEHGKRQSVFQSNNQLTSERKTARITP